MSIFFAILFGVCDVRSKCRQHHTLNKTKFAFVKILNFIAAKIFRRNQFVIRGKKWPTTGISRISIRNRNGFERTHCAGDWISLWGLCSILVSFFFRATKISPAKCLPRTESIFIRWATPIYRERKRRNVSGKISMPSLRQTQFDSERKIQVGKKIGWSDNSIGRK